LLRRVFEDEDEWLPGGTPYFEAISPGQEALALITVYYHIEGSDLPPDGVLSPIFTKVKKAIK
jgi:hypothetical protein